MARAALVALLAVLGVAGAEDAAGAKNLETAKKLWEISLQAVTDKSITPAVIEKLVGNSLSFYAPKVDCSLTPSSPLGFEMRGVPYEACSAGYAKVFGGLKVGRMEGAEFAVVAGSGGKVVLVRETFDYTVTATGEVVSGVTVERMEFNDEGLVVSDSQLFDTSKLGGATLAAAGVPPSGVVGAAWAAGAAVFAGAAVVGVFMMRAARRQPEPLLHGYEGLPA